VEYGSSQYVPNHGWVIFGRLGTDLGKTQQLASLDEEWKKGPSISSNAHDERQCIFKVILKAEIGLHL
jgi:hypothetical protein